MRYRRSRRAGATHFFTVVTEQRRAIFADPGVVTIFATALASVRDRHPFNLDAQVILPDHLHALWTLPEGDADFSTRWRLIKSTFTRAYLREHWAGEPGRSKKAKGEQSVWQRRFWEHTIRDEADFATHFDYIHYNPVGHGLVAAPRDWPHSTFGEWVARGAYEPGWGSGEMPVLPAWAGRE